MMIYNQLKKTTGMHYSGRSISKAYCQHALVWQKDQSVGTLVLVCNIPSANYQIDLSPWLSAAAGDAKTNIPVNWGDGASGTYTVSTTPGTGTIAHTFSTPGTYRIALKGSFKWGPGTRLTNLPLQKVLTSLELPTGSSPIIDVASYAFAYFSALRTIPAKLFANCPEVTSFERCFSVCYALTTIPAELFANCPNVTTFYYCFSDCTALTTIPAELFANCPKVTTFDTCFAFCSALSTIPAKLFANCTNVTIFNSCFLDCSALTTIPAELFVNCPNVEDFYYCFSGCSKVTSNLPQLWKTHSQAMGYSCFYNCTKAPNYAAALAAGWA